MKRNPFITETLNGFPLSLQSNVLSNSVQLQPEITMDFGRSLVSLWRERTGEPIEIEGERRTISTNPHQRQWSPTYFFENVDKLSKVSNFTDSILHVLASNTLESSGRDIDGNIPCLAYEEPSNVAYGFRAHYRRCHPLGRVQVILE